MRLHPWGCKFAIKNLHGKIGIVQAPNGTLYVANTGLTMQAGKSLVITDYVKTGMKRIKISLILLQDRGMDNLLVDLAGHVWAAGKHFEVNALSNSTQSISKLCQRTHYRLPTLFNPLSIQRASFLINTGPNTFYG
jgi:arylesterase/paraoxonase